MLPILLVDGEVDVGEDEERRDGGEDAAVPARQPLPQHHGPCLEYTVRLSPRQVNPLCFSFSELASWFSEREACIFFPHGVCLSKL